MSVGRIVRSTDFERVLARSPCSRSAHFAAHYLAAGVCAPTGKAGGAESDKLSTDTSLGCRQLVDDSTLGTSQWLGCVVPKRHARRAVTRNLIKREMRSALCRLDAALPRGMWVLRLRSPFDKSRFPSARSAALRTAASAELRQLLERCAGREPGTAARGLAS